MSSPLLTNVRIDEELADRLETDAAFRKRYIRMFAQSEVAAEIRRLRKARKLRQVEVATLAQTGQSAISRIEKADYDGWTFKTLIGIAEALRARLRVTFEPIEDVAERLRSPQDAADNDDAAVERDAGTAESATFDSSMPPGLHVIIQSRTTAEQTHEVIIYGQEAPF